MTHLGPDDGSCSAKVGGATGEVLMEISNNIRSISIVIWQKLDEQTSGFPLIMRKMNYSRLWLRKTLLEASMSQQMKLLLWEKKHDISGCVLHTNSTHVSHWHNDPTMATLYVCYPLVA